MSERKTAREREERKRERATGQEKRERERERRERNIMPHSGTTQRRTLKKGYKKTERMRMRKKKRER